MQMADVTACYVYSFVSVRVFKSAFESNENFKRYVNDPTIDRKTKAGTMTTIMKDSSEVTRKFVGVLCENGRMTEMESVMSDFETIMQAHKKEVSATVTSVVPLRDSDMASIKDALKGFVKPDETLKLDTKIDASILGGLVVSIGDRSIDLSVARTFNELGRELEAPIL